MIKLLIAVTIGLDRSKKMELRIYEPADGDIHAYRPYLLNFQQSKDLLIGIAHAVAFIESNHFPDVIIELE